MYRGGEHIFDLSQEVAMQADVQCEICGVTQNMEHVNGDLV